MTRTKPVRILPALTAALALSGCSHPEPPVMQSSDVATARQRIENDANMPPAAKQSALQNLERQQQLQKQHGQ